MLTPAFELKQDPTFLTIVIKARYAKVSETEIFVDGDDFKFHSKPYFLRLNLPGRLIEDGREKASYDVEAGTFTVRIPKETQGEEFQGLDLLTKLLAPSGQTSAKEPCIEVLGNNEGTGQTPRETEEDEEDFDWQVVQQPFYGDEEEKEKVNGNVMYGFANRRSGVFKRLRDEICGVVDIEEADSVSLPERKRARMMAEKEKFDDSHYLADLYQDDAIQPLLQFQPSWLHNYRKMREKMVLAGEGASSQDFTYNVGFTEEEKELMMKLPRKEFILNKVEEYGALLGVADILFAYAYNVRSNEGEYSVESAWTVCKLSSTLSCLDWFQTPREMVIACCRRALCYPLYRSWALCCKLLKDVRMMLRLGRNQVLKCFFEIHKLLSNDEPRYILNDLYISDYCVWLQSISNERLAALEQQIGEVQLVKKDVGLDLDDLEEAASLVQNEEMMSIGAKHQEQTQDNHDTHLPSQEQSVEEQSSTQSDQVIHQVGYPDLIQRNTRGPDVVTAHIVRAAETVTMAREDAADVDSDDGCNSEELKVEKGGMDESATRSRTPTNYTMSDMREVSARNYCTLENDYVDKVTIVSTDNSDSKPVRGLPSSCVNADFQQNGSGLDTMHTRTINESGNDRTTAHKGGDEVEVVGIMQDMLNQLSLDPPLQSSSTSSPSSTSSTSSSSTSSTTSSSSSSTSSSSTSSSSEAAAAALSSTKEHFPEWAQTPPTTLVEMFEEK